MTTLTPSSPDPFPARPKTFTLPFDTLLLVIIGGLVALGLLMVYSTTFDWSYRQYGDPATIFLRQAQWLALGATLMLMLARMPYQWLKRLALPLMAVTLLALIWVLVFGSAAFGAQRSFFNGSVQPSELAKFVTILYLAVWLDSKSDRLHDIGYGIVPFGIIVGLIAGLILLQPDLSAAGTVVLVAALMFFLGGADVVQMGIVAAFGAGTTFLVLQLSETGRQRLTDYLLGLQDMTQASWHIQQAAIAFINGGLFGRGLGESRQKFGFLPTPHTDSIFAIIGEELGLLGCALVIALFIALAWRGFKITSQSRDSFGAILGAGLICWVTLEALINVAVMVGVVPFAGNPLPFISYGGSNLVMTLLAMGVLLSISRRDTTEAQPRKTRNTSPLWQDATLNFGGRDRRRRVSRPLGRPNPDE
jgi:cell division protein FtsW